MRPTEWDGIFSDDRGLCTENMVPGRDVYGERIIRHQGREYRTWNPARSKLCAALLCGLGTYAFGSDTRCLYLGAASGTTVSHVSDICRNGAVFAVEFSSRSARDLIELARLRTNIYPILADARQPMGYVHMVDPGLDVIYQDVAQRDQTAIFLDNAGIYLRPGGHGYLMLKTRSVDVTASPESVLRSAVRELKEGGMEVLETVDLARFEGEHYCIALRRP